MSSETCVCRAFPNRPLGNSTPYKSLRVQQVWTRTCHLHWLTRNSPEYHVLGSMRCKRRLFPLSCARPDRILVRTNFVATRSRYGRVWASTERNGKIAGRLGDARVVLLCRYMSTCTCLTTYRLEDLVLEVSTLIGRVAVDKMIAADFTASDNEHDDIQSSLS